MKYCDRNKDKQCLFEQSLHGLVNLRKAFVDTAVVIWKALLPINRILTQAAEIFGMQR